jgi:hypothetical protein
MNPAISPARGAHRVAVIIGSTRPARICPDIAHWTREALSEDSPLCYDVIDLADVSLPFLDEPLKPALRDYEHTKALTPRWSRHSKTTSKRPARTSPFRHHLDGFSAPIVITGLTIGEPES